eukprot:1998814-Rhodomonas_salina.1
MLLQLYPGMLIVYPGMTLRVLSGRPQFWQFCLAGPARSGTNEYHWGTYHTKSAGSSFCAQSHAAAGCGLYHCTAPAPRSGNFCRLQPPQVASRQRGISPRPAVDFRRLAHKAKLFFTGRPFSPPAPSTHPGPLARHPFAFSDARARQQKSNSAQGTRRILGIEHSSA